MKNSLVVKSPNREREARLIAKQEGWMRAADMLHGAIPPILAALHCLNKGAYEELMETVRAFDTGFFNPDAREFCYVTSWEELMDEQEMFVPCGHLRIPICEDVPEHLVMRDLVNLMHTLSDADEAELRMPVFVNAMIGKILINHCSSLSNSFFGDGEHSEQIRQHLEMKGWRIVSDKQFEGLSMLTNVPQPKDGE